ncbi:MAG: DNA polymerase III subunit gamma/tau [Thermodesulfobacteriota bacterium]
MSYLVLARKWRPQSFEDVVGQEAVVRTLRNALRRGRVAHAMLFSGVRGVGKTTLARLMAKAMNCQQGEPDVPCNHCESCLEIMAGNAVDLQEIDGASNRGIQEIRELKENIRFFPSKGRYKIVIIDEVHMLTTEAFNALLKTLEEPPAHVYFMFATTELHRIPITILSRCQRYELRRVPFAGLVAFFSKIAEAEAVAVSAGALEMVAREAEGSVRDGLSLLDQLFSFGGEAISEEDVTQVLGLVDRRVFERLARALLAGDLAGCLGVFNDASRGGMDIKRFANDLLGYFRALLICRITPRPEALLDVSDQELATLRELAASSSVETLYHAFNLLMRALEEMQHSTRPRLLMEMAFVRASQAGQVVGVTELLGRLDELLAGVPLAALFSAGAPAEASQPRQEAGVAGEVAAQIVSAPAVEAQPATAIAPESTTPAALTVEAAPAARPAGRLEVKRHWDAFLRYVKERKMWMAQSLRLCASAREEGDQLVLKFDDPADCKILQEHDHLKLLTELAQDFFQHDFKVVFNVRGNRSEGEGGEEADSPLEERRALANDPLVQMAVEIFGGQVGGIRTGPRSR